MRGQDPDKVETPVLKLKVGDVVRLRKDQVGLRLDYEPRKVSELYNQSIIPGGVKVSPPIGDFVSWNEDALERVES